MFGTDVEQTTDVSLVLAAIDQVKDDLKGHPPDLWLQDENNIALVNHCGDIALFEYRLPSVYTGHYFFFSRGRQAVLSGFDFLEYVFTETPVKTIIGMTPLDKKGALWLSRRLGFEATEDTDIDGRMHRIFIMNKKDFRR